jgi:glycosyltransferase involved in cell wall biosynthesis
MNIRMVHDFLQVRGGAERVCLMLARDLPARLLVHAVAPAAGSAESLQDVDRLSRAPLATHSLLRAASAWRAFARLPAQPRVDAVLFSGHYAPLAWRAFGSARRVLYLHGPPLPFALDREDPALAGLPAPMRLLLRLPMQRLLAAWIGAAHAMHEVFANSTFVADAFARVTGRAATVLPPPVDERFFACARASEGYWISLARHEPMKRLERVVDAFRGLPDQQLVLAGDGSQNGALRTRARDAPNIRFVGALDTDALAGWLSGARASIHVSRAEPFGLAIAESLAAGVPVLTCDEGGAPALIADADAGQVLPADPDVDTLRAAIGAFAAPRDAAAVERLSSRMRRLHPAGFAAVLREALGGRAEPAVTGATSHGRTKDA